MGPQEIVLCRARGLLRCSSIRDSTVGGLLESDQTLIACTLSSETAL